MKLSKKATHRLAVLIRYMRGLPSQADGHFEMGNWFGHRGYDDHGFKDRQSVKRKDLNYCGTSACALGWAATIPSFSKKGLRLEMRKNDCYYAPDNYEGVVLFQRRKNFSAAEKFFDITPELATELFGGMEVSTPKGWARKATQIIKKFKKAEDKWEFCWG